MPICGAKTNKRTQCQNKVPVAGQRCHLHVHAAEGRGLFEKVMKVCGYIANIAGTAQGLYWIYQNAEPYIQPLLNLGLFSPERFWFHGVKVTKGQPPEVVAPALEEAIKAVLSRRDYNIKELSGYSNEQRQQISAAYDAILSNIQKDHPNSLPNGSPRTSAKEHTRSRDGREKRKGHAEGTPRPMA